MRRTTVSATKPAPELSVLREPLREVGGEQVLSGLTAALSWLEANQQEMSASVAALDEALRGNRALTALGRGLYEPLAEQMAALPT